MTSRQSVPPNVRSLIDEMLNGTISSGQVRELELALDENPTAQRFFRNYCQLHINLDAETRAQRVIDCFQDRGHLAAQVLLSTAGTTLTADELIGAAPIVNKRSPTRGWLAAACCVAAVAILAVGWIAKRPSETPDAAVAVSPEIDHANRPLLARFRLDTEEVRYIPLADFGHMMLEGPADLEFVDPMHARLLKGRIKVRITDKKGHGFIVETPHGEVKDLGTEFGVDASSEISNGVVVFEGSVDLNIPQSTDAAGVMRTARLVQGEGLTFNRGGRMSRIMSIVTGDVPTFKQGGDLRVQRLDPIIVNVADNIVEPALRMFYEIVPCGLDEDVLAYVDRPTHEWNGVDQHGIPSYLSGADYVKPFNNDKMRPDVEISVTLGRPARLFVLLDNRVSPPDWLLKDFRDTGDAIGLDTSAYTIDGVTYMPEYERGVGPGHSVEERFSVWACDVRMPGVVKLGSNSAATFNAGMYGIAAIDLGRVGRKELGK